tara:strand:+ start:19 stop:387 length:369 start_codon:yes stop_codon:yes gene_type:complete
MAEPIKITVSGILEDLKNGYTRTTGEKHYLGDEKSIQEKYGLNKSQVAELFTHEKLKGKKTISIKVPVFILEDDTENEEIIDINHKTPITDITDITDIDDSPENKDEDVTSVSSEESPEWMA